MIEEYKRREFWEQNRFFLGLAFCFAPPQMTNQIGVRPKPTNFALNTREIADVLRRIGTTEIFTGDRSPAPSRKSGVLRPGAVPKSCDPKGTRALIALSEPAVNFM